MTFYTSQYPTEADFAGDKYTFVSACLATIGTKHDNGRPTPPATFESIHRLSANEIARRMPAKTATGNFVSCNAEIYGFFDDDSPANYQRRIIKSINWSTFGAYSLLRFRGS